MKTLVLSLSLALACGTAFAAMSQQDKEFAKKAAAGGMAEVKMGRLAEANGSSANIKSFGQKMITDHSAANASLKTAAAKDNVALPDNPSPDEQQTIDKLSKLNGDAFDREYAKTMVKDHSKDVQLFRKEADSGKDPELKAFAQKTLPKLEEHLRLAKQLPGASAAKKE